MPEDDECSTVARLHAGFVEQLARGVARFPDGRVDYSGETAAPVVNCVVAHGSKVLLVKRGYKVGDHHGLWSGITGYIDRLSTIENAVMTELEQEIGLTEDDVDYVAVADPSLSVEMDAEPAGRVWITFAALVQVKTSRVRLDDENTRFIWIEPEFVGYFSMIPGQQRIITQALALQEHMPVTDSQEKGGTRG